LHSVVPSDFVTASFNLLVPNVSNTSVASLPPFPQEDDNLTRKGKSVKLASTTEESTVIVILFAHVPSHAPAAPDDLDEELLLLDDLDELLDDLLDELLDDLDELEELEELDLLDELDELEEREELEEDLLLDEELPKADELDEDLLLLLEDLELLLLDEDLLLEEEDLLLLDDEPAGSPIANHKI
jgi:hypothetical protein